jgi:hypothetical protein
MVVAAGAEVPKVALRMPPAMEEVALIMGVPCVG